MNTSTNPPTAPKSETAAVQAVESVIAQHPFLAGLQPEHLRTHTDNAILMSWLPGEMIFREGEPANRFYLFRQGRVALESCKRDEAPVLIQHIGAGDVLGWSRLTTGTSMRVPSSQPRRFSSTARDCAKSRKNPPELGYELMKRMVAVIIQRLQATRRQLLGAKPKSA